MNASVISRAMSSGCWMGGLFMKYDDGPSRVPEMPRSSASLQQRTASMTTPAEVWDYDMATRRRALRKRQQIPSGHDPARYVTTRVFAKAQDGAEVPVSLLHRRDQKIDGSAPQMNASAFRWGRLAAHDITRVEQAAAQANPGETPPVRSRTVWSSSSSIIQS